MGRLQDPANVAFLAAKGIKNPKSLLGNLKKGEAIELADGMVTPEEVLGPEKQGRKVVVLGTRASRPRLPRLPMAATCWCMRC